VGQTLLGWKHDEPDDVHGESLLGPEGARPGGYRERLMAVTPEDVREVACHLPGPCAVGLALVGPF